MPSVIWHIPAHFFYEDASLALALCGRPNTVSYHLTAIEFAQFKQQKHTKNICFSCIAFYMMLELGEL